MQRFQCLGKVFSKTLKRNSEFKKIVNFVISEKIANSRDVGNDRDAGKVTHNAGTFPLVNRKEGSVKVLLAMQGFIQASDPSPNPQTRDDPQAQNKDPQFKPQPTNRSLLTGY